MLSQEVWNTLTALSAPVAAVAILKGNEQNIVALMSETFKNKTFMLHKSQGFHTAVIDRPYNDQELDFCKHVKLLIDYKAGDANNFRLPVLHRVKHDDDGSFGLKVCIAPHGNEDSQRNELHTACCMCSPAAVMIVMSITSLYKWSFTKANVYSESLRAQ